MSEPSSPAEKQKSRSTFSLGGCLKSGRGNGTLFEYFLVVGLPTDEAVPQAEIGQPREPKILYTYPEAKAGLVDPNIKNFCFPNGVPTRGVSRRQSATDLSTIMYGALQQLESAENSFVFLVTQETLLYGVCVYNNELIEDTGPIIPQANPSDPAPQGPAAAIRRARLRRGDDVVAKRCYCFVTMFPFFNLHFEILYSILALDRLYRIGRFTSGNKSKAPGDDTPDQILGVLKSYYGQPVPGAGKAFKFHLPNAVRDVEFVCPPLDDITSLADWTIACVFKMLSLNIIVEMFASCLLEGRMLLISRDLGILSAMAIAIIPMLRPLVWQGILIPVLPAIMLDCLDAPIPIVLGLESFPEHRADAVAELYVVDVDHNISMKPRKNFEDLPDRKLLEAALEPYHKKLFSRNQKERLTNPCRTTAAEIEIVRCITKVFRKYVDKFLDSFRSAIIEKNLDIGQNNFETKIMDVVPQLPKQFRTFAKQFFETQQFNFYSEKFIKSVKKKREDEGQLYQRMSALIKLEEEERAQMEQQRAGLSILSSADRAERDRLDKLIKASKARVADLEKTTKSLAVQYPSLAVMLAVPTEELTVPVGETRTRSGSFMERLFQTKK